MRAIDGGDGTSGGSLEAHFGLGDATTIGTVRIEWRSGIVQELHDVAARQFLPVTEPARVSGATAVLESVRRGNPRVANRVPPIGHQASSLHGEKVPPA